MKKKYLPKPVTGKSPSKGAYDKNGSWWDESDIKTFTGGVIAMCFGKDRKDIEIVPFNGVRHLKTSTPQHSTTS